MLELRSSGLLTTVQDRGRFGYRKFGVPVSGVMDNASSGLANQLLGNTPDCAVLEMTLIPPVLRFLTPTIITITGAKARAILNDNPVAMYQPVVVPKDSVLRFGAITKGARVYLAVKGGFATGQILGSRSFYAPITGKSRLQKGDTIPYQPHETNSTEQFVKMNPPKALFDDTILKVHQGPEFDTLTPMMQQQLLTTEFTVNAQSTRMAFLLDTRLQLTATEITTAPVQPGTVQLTPSGKLIVLMCDAQTTGGYARVLQLSKKAINQLAQKQPGEAVVFGAEVFENK